MRMRIMFVHCKGSQQVQNLRSNGHCHFCHFNSILFFCVVLNLLAVENRESIVTYGKKRAIVSIVKKIVSSSTGRTEWKRGQTWCRPFHAPITSKLLVQHLFSSNQGCTPCPSGKRAALRNLAKILGRSGARQIFIQWNPKTISRKETTVCLTHSLLRKSMMVVDVYSSTEWTGGPPLG